MEGMGEPI